jgi:hypothetical protein
MRRHPCVRLAAGALGLAGLGVFVACSDQGDPVADEPVLETVAIAPSTSFEVGLLDVTGRSYCDVAQEVAPAVRAYSDPSTNLGTPEDVQQVYAGALQAFDALGKVAGREVTDDIWLLSGGLANAVKAASDAGWDITQISDTVPDASDAAAFSKALVHLRQYTQQRCSLDLVDGDRPITTDATETPRQRLTRVVAETFPELTDVSAQCMVDQLPVDFDPDSPTLDPAVVDAALAACGLAPANPILPTTQSPPTTQRPPTTAPRG